MSNTYHCLQMEKLSTGWPARVLIMEVGSWATGKGANNVCTSKALLHLPVAAANEWSLACWEFRALCTRQPNTSWLQVKGLKKSCQGPLAARRWLQNDFWWFNCKWIWNTRTGFLLNNTLSFSFNKNNKPLLKNCKEEKQGGNYAGVKGYGKQEVVEREHFPHHLSAEQVRDFTQGCEGLLPVWVCVQPPWNWQPVWGCPMTAEAWQLGKEETTYIRWAMCVCACVCNCLEKKEYIYTNMYIHIYTHVYTQTIFSLHIYKIHMIYVI